MDKYFKKIEKNTALGISLERQASIEIEPQEVEFSSHPESVDESEESVDEISEKNEKKRKYVTVYNPLWEQIDNFKAWLQPSNKQGYIASCTICSIFLKVSSGKNDLVKHSKSEKHLKNSMAIHPNIRENLQKSTGLDQKVLQAECQLAALVAEHNLPFLLGEHLGPFLRSAFPDSLIVKKITCGRTKLTSIVMNVLGRTQQENVCEILNNTKFSICVDESTDISTTKILSTVVRFSKNFKIIDCLFSLQKVTAADSKSIYEALVKKFIEHGIDYKANLIGYAADGANNMTGNQNSVATLLKKDCSHLIVIKCICHSFAICASYACLKLPSFVESMVRDIYNYIQNSPKRTDQFQKIMKLLELNPKKLLHPSQTRWLALEAVVDRILELYEPLKIYFAFQSNVDKIDNSKVVLDNLRNPITLLYLKFLKFILPQINKVNRAFQSETPQIHLLYFHVKTLVLMLFDCFLKPDCIKNEKIINNINYKLPCNLLPYDDLYLGVEVGLYLESQKLNIIRAEIESFKNNCIFFLQELCDQIFKRFDIQSEFFQNISLIEPRKTYTKSNVSLVNLFNMFPNLVPSSEIQKIDSEYREIRNLDFKDIFGDSLEKVGVEQFWKQIFLIKTASDSIAFPRMSKFIFHLLSLPNSSANVERTFSQINLNKTKIRNRLDVGTLEGILFCKDYLKSTNCNCHEFQINSKIRQKFNSTMYK